MTEKLQQTIKEEVDKLAKELRDAISSFDWVKITEDIGKESKLNETEIEDLQLETLLALIGVTTLKSYAVNIENQVEITKVDAEKISREAKDKIFRPIYKTLTESIRKNLQHKKPNWKQSLDFILSAGDYTVFMDTPRNEEGAMK